MLLLWNAQTLAVSKKLYLWNVNDQMKPLNQILRPLIKNSRLWNVQEIKPLHQTLGL